MPLKIKKCEIRFLNKGRYLKLQKIIYERRIE